MAYKLTNRQKEVLDYIELQLSENKGKSPTFDQIAKHFGFTTRAARDHVDAIVKKGHLSRNTYARGSLSMPRDEPKVLQNDLINKVTHKPVIADAQRDILEVPIYRKVFETEPYLRDDNIQGVLPIRFSDAQYIRDECFAFPFDYKSMSAVGVLQGDIVIARKVSGLNNNEVVLVNVKNMNTMRRVFFNGNQVILFSDNHNFEPLWYDMNDITVICKCIGVYRFSI